MSFDGINLDRQITLFIGPPDSGKSNLVKYMLSLPQYRSHLVADPLFGFDENMFNVVRPPDKSTKWRRYEYGNRWLNDVADRFVLGVESERRPRYFVVEESGRLLKNMKDEGEAMGELNDFNAHYDVGIWLLGQRLAQINTDFENKATNYFVMGYQGKNDKRTLADIHTALPEALDSLPRYGFAYVGSNNLLKTFRPVERMGEKSKM